MTTDEIREALTRFSYKPGWTFQVADHPREGQLLRIEAQVPDSYTAGKTITLGINSWLPPLSGPSALWRYLRWRITRIEIHELCEFLKVDGCVLDDPHAEEDPWERAGGYD